MKTIVKFCFGPKMKIDQDWEFKSQELHNSSIGSCETQEHFLFYSHKHSKWQAVSKNKGFYLAHRGSWS